MALLITADTITRLSSARVSTTSSQLGGKGLGLSSDASSVDLRSGLAVIQKAYTDSYSRLNTAITFSRIGEGSLAKLSGLAKSLENLAKQAADPQTGIEAQSDLSRQFTELLSEYSTTLNDARIKSTDFLSVDDLRTSLENSGINLSAATNLAQAFSQLGGTDGQLGTENVMFNTVLTNPLSVNIETKADAQKAVEVLGAFRKDLANDLTNLSQVSDELAGAINAARAGANTAGELAGTVTTSTDAESLAAQFAIRLRTAASDPMLGAHSSLDSFLVQVLTADD